METHGTPQTLRERTREAARQHIAESALGLFLTRGFDETTVEQIAAEAGISARSFFRYFPTKEDVVITDPSGWARAMADHLRGENEKTDLWSAMHRALAVLLEPAAASPSQSLASMRVIMSAESLRAANVEKHLMWAAELVPVAAARLGGPRFTRGYRASAVVHGAIGLFDSALQEWVRRGGSTSLARLLDEAFAQLPDRASTSK